MIEAEARALIESMTAWDSAPALSSAQVTLLVRAARRRDAEGIEPTGYAEWTASTAYAVGDRVYPTVRNGFAYGVTASDGAGGTTEPTWPTTLGGTITADGVTYEAVADAWTGTYDLNAAAAEGWRWKAAKVAGDFTFASDGQTFNRSDMVKACQLMARTYRDRVVGSIPLVLTDDCVTDVVGNVA